MSCHKKGGIRKNELRRVGSERNELRRVGSERNDLIRKRGVGKGWIGVITEG